MAFSCKRESIDKMSRAVSELGAASLGFMLACHCHLMSHSRMYLVFIVLFTIRPLPSSIMATTHSMSSDLNANLHLWILTREKEGGGGHGITIEVNIVMQKVERTGPVEITCNKMDAQAYSIGPGEFPLHQFVHYCKHLEPYKLLLFSKCRMCPIYLTFTLPLVKPLSDCYTCWQLCPEAFFLLVNLF